MATNIVYLKVTNVGDIPFTVGRQCRVMCGNPNADEIVGAVKRVWYS